MSSLLPIPVSGPFGGHPGPVWAVAVSPDGRTIVSAGDDGTVRCWDTGTGAAGPVLSGHTGGVLAVAISPDGRTVVSAGDDGTVRCWDAGTGAAGLVLAGHAGGVLAVAVSPDGRLIVSAGDDGTLRCWDAGTGMAGPVLAGHPDALRTVAISQDGRLIVSAGDDGIVRCWDAGTGAAGPVLSGHTDWVRAVAVSPDSRTIVSAGDDGIVRCWDAGTGAAGLVLAGHTGGVWAVAVSPDGRTVVSAGADGTVRCWDAGTGMAGLVLAGHPGGVWAVAVSPDGRTIVSAGDDGTVRCWDAGTGAAGLVMSGHTGGVLAVAISPDGRLIVSAGTDGTVQCWDAGTGEAGLVLVGHTAGVRTVAVSPDGRTIVSAGDDGTIRCWDAGTGAAGLVLAGHADWVLAVAVSPDGRTIVSAGDDGIVRCWDARTGAAGLVLAGHTDWVLAVAVSPDGRTIVSAGDDGTIRCWDARTGAAGLVLAGHTDWVLAVAINPAGDEICSGGRDGTIRMWNLHSGKQVRGTSLPVSGPAETLADPLSDEASETDLLDVTAEVNRLAALTAARSTTAPLSIALLADWGGGKSSFMMQMQRQVSRLADLSRNNRGASSYVANVRQVSFNAWHYSDEHIWVGIVQQLFRDLVTDDSPASPDPGIAKQERVRVQAALDANSRAQARLDADLKRIDAARHTHGALAGLVAVPRQLWILRAVLGQAAHDVRRSIAAVALWVAVAAVGTGLWWWQRNRLLAFLAVLLAASGPLLVVVKELRGWNNTIDKIGAERLAELNSRQESLRTEAATLRTKLAGVDAVVELSQFLESGAGSQYDRYRGVVSVVHEHLRELDRLMLNASAQWRTEPIGEPPIERIVLYVDDLDRCAPERVVDVLQAVHLLLALPLFVVVVGVDARWLRRSLEHHERTLFGEPPADAAFEARVGDPMDYLDKIFQIPFALRVMDDVAAASYIRALAPGVITSAPGAVVSGVPAEVAKHGSEPSTLTEPSDTATGPATVAGAPLRSVTARTVRRGGRVDALDDQLSRVSGLLPDLRPAGLALQPHEIDFIAALGVFLPTPRAAKKLVNLYRLVRIGVTETDLMAFALPDSDAYRAAGLLLALVVGTPTIASTALTAVYQAPAEAELRQVLMKAAEHAGPPPLQGPYDAVLASTTGERHLPGTLSDGGECRTCLAWRTALTGIDRLAARHRLPLAVGAYQQWAPESARFSFHTRPLWNRLTPQEQLQAGSPV